jgi:hypothetical protein
VEGGLSFFACVRWFFGGWFDDAEFAYQGLKQKQTMKAFSTSDGCISRAQAALKRDLLA